MIDQPEPTTHDPAHGENPRPERSDRADRLTDDRGTRLALPRPKLKRTWWPYPLIWLVPLLVAAGAAVYFYNLYQDHGTEITIRVESGAGLTAGQTPVTVQGVEVGTVRDLSLSKDGQNAEVRVQLQRGFEYLARRNTQFWIVRPDLSGGIARGLSTIVVGPHIAARPGDGESTTTFTALRRPPIVGHDGLKVLLKTDRLTHIQLESPVYYRGIMVGSVQDIRLSTDARQVNITLFIDKAYATLVRTNSRFWVVRGTTVEGGLFQGIEFRLNSLRALLAGAIEFATPDDSAPTPTPGQGWFDLSDEPDPAWLEWSPELPFNANIAGSSGESQTPLQIR